MKLGKWSRKAAVPAFGLAILAAAAPTAGAAAASDGAQVQSVEFVGMPAPATAREMAQIYTAASVKVTYTDGTSKLFPLSYRTLFRSNEQVGGTIAGVATDKNNQPITDASVPNDPVPYVSDAPDANSLLQVPGARPTGKGGNPLSLVTHYEYITLNHAGNSAYGIVPASMSLATIDQNKMTGELTPVALSKIDFSGVDGLWIPCNGSLTPWGTHLGSEEYEADARAYEADPTQTYVGSFAQNFYQNTTKTGNPYAYGYIPEVTVRPDNTAAVVKHYSMGRFSHELARVAPDMKTVFFGDDGGNTMLFLYVADKAKDLSAGTLYAAKWVQQSAAHGGSANLQWIRLGHATDAEVKAYIDKGVKFSDIFETSDRAAAGFTAVKTYPSGKVEYLKVKPGMEQAAAFLESRRYGAILGATAEFNKMEGVAVNARDRKIYVAMSYVEKSMEKDAKGADPADDIQVDKISAGVVYEMSTAGGQKDKDGAAIASDYVPSFMQGLVWGEDLPAPDAKGDTANDDRIANPDNLSYSEDLRTLFIGEDSGMHANNYVWAYNIDTKKLSRILSTPAGAEATGLQAVDNLNGFSYIMSNFQHPGDEMIVAPGLKPQVEQYINQLYDNKKAGFVGYIAGLPSRQQMLAYKAEDGRSVALRATAEAAGASVVWNAASREATVVRGGHTLVLREGSDAAVLDGQTIRLPAAPRFEKDRLIVPAGALDAFLMD
jgi:hypothetical protein